MLPNVALRTVLKTSAGVLRDLCSAAPVKPLSCSTAVLAGQRVSCVAGGVAVPLPVRYYARVVKKKVPAAQSQLSDLPPTMLRMDYSAVPLAQTTDDIVRRLLSLELASHRDKLHIKTEQLIAKVQRDENDRSSVEVGLATLTARIRNLQEHLQKHRKDKANKRRMLMAIDRRKKLLKHLRLVDYDAFEKVCEQLGITYTFPPEYHRRITKRWLAKKALCMKVYKEVQKQKAEQRQLKKNAASSATKEDKTKAETQK